VGGRVTYEIRRDATAGPGQRDIDEVIIRAPRFVHFERMNDGEVWCGITLANGETLHVDIATGKRCRHRLYLNAEER